MEIWLVMVILENLRSLTRSIYVSGRVETRTDFLNLPSRM